MQLCSLVFPDASIGGTSFAFCNGIRLDREDNFVEHDEVEVDVEVDVDDVVDEELELEVSDVEFDAVLELLQLAEL